MRGVRVIAGLFIVLMAVAGMSRAAHAETRTLKIYFVHTKERAEITYKRDGRYIKDGLEKVNWILRDWRRNQATTMDPKLLDILWEVYRQTGSRDYIHVLSGYRSPATNAALRARSSGVAENSLHRLGKAVDFYLPDVQLKKVRDTGLRLQWGGVGYYPRSGSPFVHLDSGNVRHWPGISRAELAAVFPNGRTVHVPSDGKPLAGYQLALADVQKNKSSPTPQIVAEAPAQNSRRSGGILNRLFGGGVEEDEDNIEMARTQIAANRAAPPKPEDNLPAIRQAQVPQAQQPAISNETPATILAGLQGSQIPLPSAAPRAMPVVAAAVPAPVPAQPDVPQSMPFQVASLESEQRANIPLPTPRPSHRSTVAGEPGIVQVPTEVAALAGANVAAASSGLPQVMALLPSQRPSRSGATDAIAGLIRTDSQPQAVANTTTVEPVAVAYAQPSTAAGVLADVTAETAAKPQLAALVEPAVATSKEETRTTGKGMRLAAADAVRTAPKAQAVPVGAKVPAAIMRDGRTASGAVVSPVYSARLAEQPEAVYTVGFSKDGGANDPRKLSGKAVTFMTIARFN